MSGRADRRTAFHFALTRPDGVSERVIFYALDKQQAEGYARAWAEARGFVVEPVQNESEA